jgi:hypothetical protein
MTLEDFLGEKEYTDSVVGLGELAFRSKDRGLFWIGESDVEIRKTLSSNNKGNLRGITQGDPPNVCFCNAMLQTVSNSRQFRKYWDNEFITKLFNIAKDNKKAIVRETEW